MRLAASLPVPPDLAMCRRVAERVEALGYDSVWIADTGAGPDAFVVGAAVATVHGAAPHRHRGRPRLHAHAVGHGRRAPAPSRSSRPGASCSGIGASSETIVDAWGGVPFERPLQRMRETVDVLRQMLAGERVTFAGTHDPHAGLPPRVAAAAAGARSTSPALMPPMLELAGEIADGVILNFMPVEAVPRMLEHVRRGAERAGRDPSGSRS